VRHPWPLNIRELEHCLRSALAISPSRIEVEHLPRSIRDPSAGGPAKPRRRLTSEQTVLREQLCTLLKQHSGNISAVARELNKDRVQIRRWIKQLDIIVDELRWHE
jgi:DNA-binding NtrC family response regulator